MQARYRKPSSNTNTMIYRVTLNAKGYPTVGHLRPKSKYVNKEKEQEQDINQEQEKDKENTFVFENHFLINCVSLETTAQTFSEIVGIIDYMESCRVKRNTSHLKEWCEQVYLTLYKYVNKAMQPSLEDMDAMELVCNVLLEHKMKRKMEEFILRCPKKFIVMYANSENTLHILHQLDLLGLRDIRAYLITFSEY